MKHLIATLALCAVVNLVSAQTLFERRFGGSGNEYGYGVSLTSDGGFVYCGETNSAGAGSFDAFLTKTDATGAVQWSRTYGTADWDWANAVRQTADGGFIVVGGTENNPDELGDILIFKTDAAGNLQWQLRSDGGDYDNGSEVRVLSNGGFAVVGHQWTNDSTQNDIVLIRIDGSGTVLWKKVYKADHDNWGYDLEQTADGGFIIAGETNSGQNSNALVIKTDASGNVQWSKTYGGSTNYWATGVKVKPNGSYVVSGSAWVPSANNVWIAGLNSAGVVTWSNAFEGFGDDNTFNLAAAADGGFVVCGRTNSFVGNYDAMLIKTDSLGFFSYLKTFGGSGYESAAQVEQTSDGGFVLVATSSSFGNGESVYLIKTNAIALTNCNDAAFTMSQYFLNTTEDDVTINTQSPSNTTTIPLVSNTGGLVDSAMCLTVSVETVKERSQHIELYPNPASAELTLVANGLVGEASVWDVTGREVLRFNVSRDVSVLDVRTLPDGVYLLQFDNAPVQRFVVTR